jgi:hypothetical protein
MAAVLISSAMMAIGGVFYAFTTTTRFLAGVRDVAPIELILAPIRRHRHCSGR